jgi:NAD-dependent deacetylase
MPAKSSSYTAFERRAFKDAHPLEMTIEQLAQLCKTSNVIFYTGAGISAGSQVPMMAQLMKGLDLEEGEHFIDSLRKVVQDPEKAAAYLRHFHKACILHPPTPAHKALAELASGQIVTENVDYLHEWTGIKPYRIEGDRLRCEIDPKTASSIDAIICVGLSVDDKGFLGWYKHHHPQGKIIAIDLKQPTYLGDEDYFLCGDLQEIIPSLASQRRSGEL